MPVCLPSRVLRSCIPRSGRPLSRPQPSTMSCLPSRWLLAPLALLVFVRALPQASAAEPTTETRFVGVLSEAGSDDAILRRFDVLLYNSESGGFFCVFDDARTGCPWPDSFGDLAAAATRSGPMPHLLYDYDGTMTTIPLPPLQLDVPPNAVPDEEWTSGLWTCHLIADNDAEGRSVRTIQARETRGRRMMVTVARDSGVLVDARLDVFMGRGDRFLLTLQQSASETLVAAEAERVARTQASLMTLQQALDRRPDSEQRTLSPRQVSVAESLLPELVESAAATGLAELVQRMQTDLIRQRSRLDAGAMQAEKLVGRSAPRYALTLLNGRTLESGETTGQTVVLHFWDYRDEPLSEPYGQTGYLDFLHNQLDSDTVRFVGVSTNSEFHSPDTVARAQRSARKLVEFMNLSYDVGYDDGALLRSLGDPRSTGGQLPLWLVIGPDGQILHYATGYYEIDERAGLKELRDLLTSD